MISRAYGNLVDRTFCKQIMETLTRRRKWMIGHADLGSCPQFENRDGFALYADNTICISVFTLKLNELKIQ